MSRARESGVHTDAVRGSSQGDSQDALAACVCVCGGLTVSVLCDAHFFVCAAMSHERVVPSAGGANGNDDDDVKQRVMAALSRPENARCADCDAPSPKYVPKAMVALRYHGVRGVPAGLA